jgi:hypothetical protein
MELDLEDEDSAVDLVQADPAMANGSIGVCSLSAK